MRPDAKPTVFTLAELRRYRGDNEGAIYLSVKGVVYNVTSSRHLYGPEGPYHVFAGKECARALALLSVHERDCVGDLHRLDEDQLTALEEWVAKFREKYPIVGYMSESFFQRVAHFFMLG